MEKLTLSAVVDEIETVEHNGRIRQLAGYYHAVETEVNKLQDRLDDLYVLHGDILSVAEQPEITEEDMDQFRGRIPGGLVVGSLSTLQIASNSIASDRINVR